MKNGLILYVVGSAPLSEELNLTETGAALGCPADRVELVSRDVGFFSVEDAWHFLATRGGCGRIRLVVAEVQQDGRLRPLSPEVRLSG